MKILLRVILVFGMVFGLTALVSTNSFADACFGGMTGGGELSASCLAEFYGWPGSGSGGSGAGEFLIMV